MTLRERAQRACGRSAAWHIAAQHLGSDECRCDAIERELRAVVEECLDCCDAEGTIEGIHERIEERIRKEFGSPESEAKPTSPCRWCVDGWCVDTRRWCSCPIGVARLAAEATS